MCVGALETTARRASASGDVMRSGKRQATGVVSNRAGVNRRLRNGNSRVQGLASENVRLEKVRMKQRIAESVGRQRPSINSRMWTFAWIALVRERAHTSSKWSKESETAPWTPWSKSVRGRERMPSCLTENTVLSAILARLRASWSGWRIFQ